MEDHDNLIVQILTAFAGAHRAAAAPQDFRFGAISPRLCLASSCIFSFSSFMQRRDALGLTISIAV